MNIDVYFTPQAQTQPTPAKGKADGTGEGFLATLLAFARQGMSNEELLAALQKSQEGQKALMDGTLDTETLQNIGEQILGGEFSLNIEDAFDGQNLPSLEDIQNLIARLANGDKNADLDMIAADLSMEEIAALKDLAALDSEEDQAAALALFTIIQIIDPQAAKDKVADTLSTSEKLIDLLRNLKANDDFNEGVGAENDSSENETLIAQINALLAPITGSKQLIEDVYAARGGGAGQQKMHSDYYADDKKTNPATSGNDKGANSGQKSEGQKTADQKAAIANALKNNASLISAITSGTIDLSALSGLTGVMDYNDPVFEQLVMAAGKAQYGAAANSTSPVTQSASAGSGHPAHSLIKASMQKAANSANGEKTLRLQLDPPELGRVEVRMTMGKDNKVKALIIAEKPETHLMLQRDGQLLERSLQDTGVETDGGIDFQLAEQGFDFDQNNQRGGGHDNGGTGAGNDAEEIELIESTMTFHVDPETGHMRYNILA